MLNGKTIFGIVCTFAGGVLFGCGVTHKEDYERYETSGDEFIFPVDDYEMSLVYDEDLDERVYILSSKLDSYVVEDHEEYEDILEELSYTSNEDDIEPEEYDEEEEMIEHNIFDDAEEEVVTEEDIPIDTSEYYINRDGTDILMVDEAKFNNIGHYDTEELYFHTNGIVVDGRNEVVENYKDILGDFVKDSNFGVGSGDPDVMYICNHNTQTYYMVIRESLPWRDPE